MGWRMTTTGTTTAMSFPARRAEVSRRHLPASCLSQSCCSAPSMLPKTERMWNDAGARDAQRPLILFHSLRIKICFESCLCLDLFVPLFARHFPLATLQEFERFAL